MVEFPCPPIRSTREIFHRRLFTITCSAVASVSVAIIARSRGSGGGDDKSNAGNTRALAATALGTSTALLAMLGIGCGGPRWSPWYNLLGISEPKMIVRGTVQPGYEPVLEAFQTNLKIGQDDGVQFTAYVKGRCVVDLAGSVVASSNPNDRLRRYEESSYVCCWSSSKVLESTIIAWLVDQGRISYDAKIKDVWPEFTGGGKELLTLRDVMKHEAGLKAVPFDVPVQLEEFLPENIKAGCISKQIEGWECKFPEDPKSKQEYHALTRGMILNEIVRRVDPKGRTMGEILREEFTEPLGIDKECYAGVPKDMSDISTNDRLFYNTPPARFMWVLWHKLSCLVGLDRSRWDNSLLFTIFVLHYPLLWTRWKEFVNPKHKTLLDLAATPLWCRGEILSGNVCTSARGLAAIANVLSQRNPNFFQGDGLEKAMANVIPTPVGGTGVEFNDGGWARYTKDVQGCGIVGINDAIGWQGWNGSWMVFHPDGDFALAFNPLAFGDLMMTPTSRIGRLVSSFVECSSVSNGDKKLV